jgi:hypothetical protein
MQFKAGVVALALSLAALGVGRSMALSAERSSTNDDRPRLIVLTDIGNEPDDSESMVRLLLYSNDIDIEGLIAATSRHLPQNPHPELIKERIAAYAKALSNLRAHDPRYPDSDVLLQRVRQGSPVYGMSGVGQAKDTEASQLIVNAVDKSDSRPVWIAAWGGAADLAQALWTVRATRSEKEVDRFVSKLRVYSISDQDDAGPWARAYFPKLFWITNIHGFTRYALGTWLGISAPMPGADQGPVSVDWLNKNIQRGPLGALYPTPRYIMEGDTPSFLNLIPNGLSVPQRPDWGGWGGRFDRLSDSLGLWTTTIDAAKGTDGHIYSTPQATIWRWRPAFQNDFAARMSWTITPDVRSANHPPAVQLNGTGGESPVEIEACPGTPITLSAKGSSDPDGDGLSNHWFWYREAGGLFSPDVKLSAETGEEISVTIGDAAHVDQFAPPSTYRVHVILEAIDNGSPTLTRYRRAILSVPGLKFGTTPQACQVQPIPPSH